MTEKFCMQTEKTIKSAKTFKDEYLQNYLEDEIFRIQLKQGSDQSLISGLSTRMIRMTVTLGF